MSESYTKSNDHSIVVWQVGYSYSWDPLGVKGAPFPYTTRFYVHKATDSFTGVRNPRWKEQIRLGQGATTHANGVRYRVISREPFQSFQRQVRNSIPFPPSGNPYIFEDTTFGEPDYAFEANNSVTAAVQASVDNRAIRKFLNACESARSSVELGQDIGEIKQTIEGILHPMKSMQNLVKTHLKDFKKNLRGKRLKRKILHKAVADSYLEFTFGWKPLANDIADGIAGLISRHTRPSSVPVRGSAMEPFRFSEGGNRSLPQIFGTALYYRSLSTGIYYNTLTGAIRTGPVDGDISSAQVLQLDAQHFLPTLWDLIPYSFVADYFVNIGDIISSVCFRFGELAWGQRTTRTKNVGKYATYTGLETNYSGFHTDRSSYSGGNAELETLSFVRDILEPQDLMPSFRFSVPISSKPWENLGFLAYARASNAAIAEEFRKFW